MKEKNILQMVKILQRFCHMQNAFLGNQSHTITELLETVDVKDLGHCCEACGVQQTTPGVKKKCDFISYDSQSNKCTLSTGQGSLCGQKNSVTNSFHGPEAPSPKPPPPPPPPPLSRNPCIRFGHAIPVANHVDAMILQESDPSVNYTWTNMAFVSSLSTLSPTYSASSDSDRGPPRDCLRRVIFPTG